MSSYGVGINDAGYPAVTIVDGKKVKCPYIARWQGLIKRVYREEDLVKQPTYRGCSVEDVWLLSSGFIAWMQVQKWKGLQLDKDIIVPGNKVYGPEFCAFVPRYVNALFNTHNLREKVLPLGVSLATKSSDMINELNNPYVARVRLYNVIKHLGCFSNALDAHKAWQLGKIDVIENVMGMYLTEDSFNQKVYYGMGLRIVKLKSDHQKGVITEWL